MSSVPVSIYNNTCPTGRIRLPQISANLSSSGSGFTIDQSKFTTNNWSDGDLCYDICNNGDVPHLDTVNGVYYCVAPANIDANGSSTCMSSDISNNNSISTSYTQTTLADYNPSLMSNLNKEWVPPFISSNASKSVNFPLCKRPVLGVASKQTLFDSNVIATNVMRDILSDKQ